MLNVQKRANLKDIVLLGLGIGLGWFGHSYLASRGEIVKNYGISFGLTSGIFIFLSIIFVLFLFWFWWKQKSLGLEIILVGGVINLIDRFVFGYVRDYWWFFKVYNNLADWLIGIGIILFLLKIYGKKDTNNF